MVTPAAAQPSEPSLQVGDTYEITKTRVSESHGELSSGSSHDRDTLIERIEARRSDGLELIFDLPAGTTANERKQVWQLPARVLKPREGPLKLLNGPELEKRVDAWLKWGKMSPEACGHWIFTWNAFRIECDPQSVIAMVQAFDPVLPVLREGAVYRDARALAPAPLTRKNRVPSGSTFITSLAIDPTAVQRDRAQADVVVGEIMRKPVAIEAALAARTKEAVTGTIDVRIDTDATGNVVRLSKVTKTQTTKPDGNVQTETITETLERRLLPSNSR